MLDSARYFSEEKLLLMFDDYLDLEQFESELIQIGKVQCLPSIALKTLNPEAYKQELWHWMYENNFHFIKDVPQGLLVTEGGYTYPEDDYDDEDLYAEDYRRRYREYLAS